jgi:hypothetical protein
MKKITMITKFILIALTVLLFASCNQSINLKVTGSGHYQNRTVQGEFKSIEVKYAIDLIIDQIKRNCLLTIYKKISLQQ